MKRLFLLILFIYSLSYLSADDITFNTFSENERDILFYAGINPMALIAFMPNPIGVIGTGFGILSGQEFGISIYGGIHFAQSHSFEIRFSTGPADIIVWDTQIQFGYLWYPFEQFLSWNGGLSTGLMLRQFFWNNRITDNTIFNITPELLLGWRFITRQLAFDVRAGWNLASLTWSNMPNTKAGIGWTTFPYNVNIIFGIAWLFGS